MDAQYVARYGRSKVTHSIREGWSYDDISNARTACCGRKGPFSVEHLQSGTPLAVTCSHATSTEPMEA